MSPFIQSRSFDLKCVESGMLVAYALPIDLTWWMTCCGMMTSIESARISRSGVVARARDSPHAYARERTLASKRRSIVSEVRCMSLLRASPWRIASTRVNW